MTVDPADMWAYATRPIADPDPNEPLLAVTRAADAAEPRVVRASHGAMVDGRFTYWVGPIPGDDMCAEERYRRRPPRDVPWSIRDQHGEEVGVIWTGQDTTSITTDRPGCTVVKVTDPAEVRRYLDTRDGVRTLEDDLADAKQRTRRDVAAIIT